MIKKKNISKDDIDTWQNYIKNPSDISNKDESIDSFDAARYRFQYDLHGYSLRDAHKKVKEIVLMCVRKKYKEILLITGKGIHANTDNNVYVSKNLSKLKYSVPDYIKSDLDISKYISSTSNADLKDGGEGAIIIKLRKL